MRREAQREGGEGTVGATGEAGDGLGGSGVGKSSSSSGCGGPVGQRGELLGSEAVALHGEISRDGPRSGRLLEEGAHEAPRDALDVPARLHEALQHLDPVVLRAGGAGGEGGCREGGLLCRGSCGSPRLLYTRRCLCMMGGKGLEGGRRRGKEEGDEEEEEEGGGGGRRRREGVEEEEERVKVYPSGERSCFGADSTTSVSGSVAGRRSSQSSTATRGPLSPCSSPVGQMSPLRKRMAPRPSLLAGEGEERTGRGSVHLSALCSRRRAAASCK